ncbi:MAG: lysine transporter LysE [SAR86 cluster bacterium]|uniref:Lysine transporter LysE n=1 Tax=SAR86 cluster bacterium TaxID=2030880 RepID=A0A2A5AWQ4_9GAMM|nr:MAG: lysine transporter LysE [SAR86 cluster bacterium]
MSIATLISFSLISIAFIAMPGPNVLIVVSTSLQAGKTRGLQTVAGTSCAMVLQLVIAAVGTSWLLTTVTEGLFWLKWCGVIYLFYLGFSALRKFYRHQSIVKPSAAGSFSRGFWVSLTNPKTILFFSAFLPQFVSTDSSYMQQVAILSLCFWLIAAFIDCSYAVLAARVKWLLESRQIENQKLNRLQNGFSAILYIGAGSLLANTNKF